VLKSVAILPVAPPPSTPIPVTRNFVATDRQGNSYVSHTLRRVIEKYSPQGQRLATLKGFTRPEAVAVDEDGNVYVVDFNQVKIVRAARPHLFGGTKPTAKPARPGAAK
jgi:DNA-binding beta-propeller fold protein YncE